MAVDFLAEIPPHDLEAEKSVLGSILLDNDALIDVLDTVELGDFYVEKNRQIFEAMLRLWDDHQPIDPITLGAELRARGNLDSISNGYIAEMASFPPTARNAGHYGAITHGLALVRDFGRIAYQVSIDSLESHDASEFLDERASAV
jgi:replicative DNA helicase